jgi:hypothetical protein
MNYDTCWVFKYLSISVFFYNIRNGNADSPSRSLSFGVVLLFESFVITCCKHKERFILLISFILLGVVSANNLALSPFLYKDKCRTITRKKTRKDNKRFILFSFSSTNTQLFQTLHSPTQNRLFLNQRLQWYNNAYKCHCRHYTFGCNSQHRQMSWSDD